MKPQGKKIPFTITACPGSEQLLLYTKGSLGAAEKHRVELHLVDCELCSDAVEGLEMITGPVMLDNMMTEGRRRFGRNEEALAGSRWKIMAAAASVALLIVSSVWIYYLAQVRVSKNLSDAEIIKSHEQAPVVLPQPPAGIQSSSGIEPQKEKEKEAFTNAATWSSVKRNKVSENVEASEAENQSQMMEEPLEAAAVKSDASKAAGGAAGTFSAPVQQAAKPEGTLRAFDNNSNVNEIRYVEGLKTLAEKEEDPADSLLVADRLGVEAKYENDKDKLKKERLSSDVDEMHYVSYNSLLDRGIHYFKKKDYANALDIFNLIIGARNKDENALFYGALSNDGLNRHAAAAASLEVILRNRQSAFYEESKWHLALIRLKEGKKSDATDLLHEIIDEKGFYSQQASLKLEEIR
jgi:hypothetical protein